MYDHHHYHHYHQHLQSLPHSSTVEFVTYIVPDDKMPRSAFLTTISIFPASRVALYTIPGRCFNSVALLHYCDYQVSSAIEGLWVVKRVGKYAPWRSLAHLWLDGWQARCGMFSAHYATSKQLIFSPFRNSHIIILYASFTTNPYSMYTSERLVDKQWNVHNAMDTCFFDNYYLLRRLFVVLSPWKPHQSGMW